MAAACTRGEAPAHGVGAVDLAGVKGVLERIWDDKPRVSQVVRADIESVLNYVETESQRNLRNCGRRGDGGGSHRRAWLRARPRRDQFTRGKIWAT